MCDWLSCPPPPRPLVLLLVLCVADSWLRNNDVLFDQEAGVLSFVPMYCKEREMKRHGCHQE